MTLAELKRRLQPGTRLTLLRNAKGPCEEPRIVVRQLRYDCVLARPDGQESHLQWPRFPGGQFIRDTADGFEIVNAAEHVMLAYRWGSP